MPRFLSSTVYPAIYGQQTAAAALWLLTIEHPTLSVPLRFVNNPKDVVSRGNTYVGAYFEPRLPDDIEDRLPELELAIDNVDRRIVEAVQRLPSTGPATSFTAEIVFSTALNTPEVSFTLKMRKASWDALVVRATLTGADEMAEGFPGRSFTPKGFPGLYLDTVTTIRPPSPPPAWPPATPPITIPVPVTSPQYNPFQISDTPPLAVTPGAPVAVTPQLVTIFIDGNAGLLNASGGARRAEWHTANTGTVSANPPFSDVPIDAGLWWLLNFPIGWTFLDLGQPASLIEPSPLYGQPLPATVPDTNFKLRQGSVKVGLSHWYENGRIPGSRLIGDVVNRWWFLTPPPGPMGLTPV